MSSHPDPHTTAALKPPKGVTSNFIDPPSQGYVCIIAMVIYLVVTTPFVVMRMYTRKFINRRVWWDDYTSVLAWVGLVGLTVIIFDALNYGMGKDMWNVTVADAAIFSEHFHDLEIVARLSIFFAKLSILLLFLRIFVPPGSRKGRIFFATWFVIWFNLLYCIALVLVVLTECVNKHMPRGATCINSYLLLVTASIINVISDLVMLVIPIYAVWHLQLAKKRKFGLTIVFAVGSLAVVASAARLGFQVVRAHDKNQTILLMTVSILAIAEQAVGIIVGCMPVLPAFFRHISDQSSSSSKPSAKGYMSSFVSSRKGRPSKGSANDPYLISKDYQELDDLETGAGDGKGTTTTTIKGGRSGSLIGQEPIVEELQESPNISALVQKSVLVESHPRVVGEPRVIGEARTTPLPVHIRR